MTRYAIDAAIALRLVREDSDADKRHSLVAPAILRSHALSMLYRDVRAGVITSEVGREQLEGIARLKIRLLGDRVSRAVAWKIAAELDWEDTAKSEYLAVASLQADALITDDDELAAAASGVVRRAPYEDLAR